MVQSMVKTEEHFAIECLERLDDVWIVKVFAVAVEEAALMAGCGLQMMENG